MSSHSDAAPRNSRVVIDALADRHGVPRELAQEIAAERESFRRKSLAHNAWMDALARRLEAEQEEAAASAAYEREADRHEREFGEE